MVWKPTCREGPRPLLSWPRLLAVSASCVSGWIETSNYSWDSDKEVGTILPGRTTFTNKLISTSRYELSQWMDRGVVPQPGQRQRGWDEKRVKAEARLCDTKTCGVSVRVAPTIPLFLSMLVLERRRGCKIDLNCGVLKKGKTISLHVN